MEVDLIFKIAAVGIIVTILNQVLVRSGREEQATMTTPVSYTHLHGRKAQAFQRSKKRQIHALLLMMGLLYAKFTEK